MRIVERSGSQLIALEFGQSNAVGCLLSRYAMHIILHIVFVYVHASPVNISRYFWTSCSSGELFDRVCQLPSSHYVQLETPTWISSILKIRATVSVANSSALVDTSNGWTTFSSMMFEMMP